MIAVIFEVTAKTDRKDEYFEIVGELKVMLTEMDGFISTEAFKV